MILKGRNGFFKYLISGNIDEYFFNLFCLGGFVFIFISFKVYSWILDFRERLRCVGIVLRLFDFYVKI